MIDLGTTEYEGLYYVVLGVSPQLPGAMLDSLVGFLAWYLPVSVMVATYVLVMGEFSRCGIRSCYHGGRTVWYTRKSFSGERSWLEHMLVSFVALPLFVYFLLKILITSLKKRFL